MSIYGTKSTDNVTVTGVTQDVMNKTVLIKISIKSNRWYHPVPKPPATVVITPMEKAITSSAQEITY